MRNFANNIFRWYYQRRFSQIEQFVHSPYQTQQTQLTELIHAARNTVWGRKYDFSTINNQADFARQVPIQDYDSLKPFITQMMEGKEDILWPGQVKMFSKSSGTTNDKSKFIPVSKINLKQNHIKGTWDTMTMLYHR